MFEDILEKLQAFKLYLALGGVVILAVIFLFMQSSKHTQADQTNLAHLTSSTSLTVESSSSIASSESSAPSTEIAVDVKGAVKSPDVYVLPADSRVTDAIKLAGGMTAQADAKSINLAAKLTDEEVVYVATKDEAVSVLETKSATSSSSTAESDTDLINLNTATASDLQTISGIGEKRANDIIAYRDSQGGFTSVDDLGEVSGIGDKTLENIRPYVTVD